MSLASSADKGMDVTHLIKEKIQENIVSVVDIEIERPLPESEQTVASHSRDSIPGIESRQF